MNSRDSWYYLISYKNLRGLTDTGRTTSSGFCKKKKRGTRDHGSAAINHIICVAESLLRSFFLPLTANTGSAKRSHYIALKWAVSWWTANHGESTRNSWNPNDSWYRSITITSLCCGYEREKGKQKRGNILINIQEFDVEAKRNETIFFPRFFYSLSRCCKYRTLTRYWATEWYMHLFSIKVVLIFNTCVICHSGNWTKCLFTFIQNMKNKCKIVII